jgi:hypothetical protein
MTAASFKTLMLIANFHSRIRQEINSVIERIISDPVCNARELPL